MQYPTCPFMLLYNAYRIARQGGGEDGARPLYFVQRPDGSECCRDVTWVEVEPAIRRDMESTGWPADALPPDLAAEINSGPRTPSISTPTAKTSRTRARPCAPSAVS